VENKKKPAPIFQSHLRHGILNMPPEAYEASGIVINGRRIKTLIFTTDLAIIKNCDADAVFAVYPFTPQLSISDAIIKASYIPVFCGVGGGTTRGPRTVSLAKDAEGQGAMGVVVNSPIPSIDIQTMSMAIDIPIIATVVKAGTNFREKLDAGASILNVAGGGDTPDIVREIRESLPDVPIIASGGPDRSTVKATIQAGANAITYTPPTAQELFRDMMEKYRA